MCVCGGGDFWPVHIVISWLTITPLKCVTIQNLITMHSCTVVTSQNFVLTYSYRVLINLVHALCIYTASVCSMRTCVCVCVCAIVSITVQELLFLLWSKRGFGRNCEKPNYKLAIYSHLHCHDAAM